MENTHIILKIMSLKVNQTINIFNDILNKFWIFLKLSSLFIITNTA